MAYLPPDQAVVGNELAVSYMEELYPVTVGAATPRRCSTRPTSGSRADPMTNVLVCIKRVPDAAGEVALTADAQARRRPLRRVHDQRPRELRRGAGGAGRRRHRGHGDRADPRADDAVEQLRTALGVGCSAAVLSRPTPSGSVPPTWPARSPRSSAPRGAGRLRPGAARQRRRRHRRLPGRHPARLRAGPAGGQRRGTVAVDGDGRHGAGRRARRRRDLRGAAARGRHRAGGRRRAALPDDLGPDEGEEGQDRDRAPHREPPGSGRVRLLLPPAQPSAVEVLGEGPDAAKAVVDLLEKLGVAR